MSCEARPDASLVERDIRVVLLVNIDVLDPPLVQQVVEVAQTQLELL